MDFLLNQVAGGKDNLIAPKIVIETIRHGKHMKTERDHIGVGSEMKNKGRGILPKLINIRELSCVIEIIT